MSLDFGKLNFSVSFNPTSAFPIDARCYFESYAAAEAAAAKAEAAGSTNTVYYYGQNVVVVEDNVASFYIIQPDGTLGEVGGKVTINTSLFEYDEDGNLSLKGFADAVAGAQLVKSADNTLSWIKPDSTTVEGLSTAVETLRKDVDNLTKNVYTKTEVEKLISDSAHLKRKIVDKVEDILAYITDAEDEEHYIFMVRTGLQEEADKYDEYIVIDGTIEKIGSWEVNLDDYATKEDLKDKVDKIEGYGLISDEDVNKLNEIEEGAEKNYISSVEEAQFQVIEGKLKLIAVQQDIITGLADTLRGKVDVVEGKGLSTNDFTNELKTKLETIPIADLNAALSKVNALDKDIYGYQDEEGNEVPGLIAVVPQLQNELNLLTQTVNTNSGSIQTLNSTVGTLTQNINTLTQTVNDFADTYVSIANFNTVVGNLDSMLENQVNIMNEINNINNRLTWQGIED